MPSLLNTLNLDGDFVGTPAAVSWELGRIDVFVRDRHNNVLHKFQRSPTNTWLPSQTGDNWETLASGACSDITAVSWGPHRIDLFWIGSQNAIQHIFWDGDVWQKPGSLGGQALGTIAAVSYGVGNLAVFHRGMRNSVYVNMYSNGNWSGWNDLGGEIVGSPVAASWGANRIDVFHRGGRLDVYHMYYDSGKWSGSWKCTQAGASITSDITAAAPAASPGILYLFGIDASNKVVVQECINGKWGPFTARGDVNPRSPPASIAATSIAGNPPLGCYPVIAVQGHDNSLYFCMCLDQGVWTPWQRFGDQHSVTAMPVLAPNMSRGPVPVFVRNNVAKLVLMNISLG